MYAVRERWEVDKLKRRWMTLACAAALAAGLILPAGAAGSRFADVPAGAWYAEAVEAAAEKGYMTGVDSTHFAPEGTVTRATVVTVLWRMAGSPAAGTSAGFTDVTAGAWYAGAVDWAAQAGIAGGDGQGHFRPDAAVTRQELAVLLARYDDHLGTPMAEGALNLFDDAAQISDWATDGVAHAVGMGWLEGAGGKIDPQGTASRAQLAAILERMSTPAMG